MHCPVYHITMGTAHCLLYQARAAGTAQSKSTYTSGGPSGTLVVWAQKYKPCLTCETGKQIAAGRGDDSDVETLKQTHKVGQEQTKLCPRCKEHLPKSSFGPHSGNKDGLQCYCRQCQRQIQNERNRKAREEQSKNEIKQVISTKWDSNQQMNTPIPPPSPVERTPESTATRAARTCRDCGHTGPEADFYQTKLHGVTEVCRKCVQRKRSKKFAENKAASMNIGKHGIILDFSEYPDIFEEIKKDSVRNFRTVDNEIIYRLVNYAK